LSYIIGRATNKELDVSGIDLVVLIAGLALIGFLLWFFFGPKQGKAVAIRSGVQEATIRVEGAYQPNVVTVKAGLPVRLTFDRRDTRLFKPCCPAELCYLTGTASLCYNDHRIYSQAAG
jgi:plastocyanin domain-containing protein